jgi:hypothetical protein
MKTGVKRTKKTQKYEKYDFRKIKDFMHLKILTKIWQIEWFGSLFNESFIMVYNWSEQKILNLITFKYLCARHLLKCKNILLNERIQEFEFNKKYSEEVISSE